MKWREMAGFELEATYEGLQNMILRDQFLQRAQCSHCKRCISYSNSVTEYACAVWHSSITAEQRDQLEAIQRQAVRIIFGKELDFDILAIIHDIPLADRRDRQIRQLFTGMHDSSHCLHRQCWREQ